MIKAVRLHRNLKTDVTSTVFSRQALPRHIRGLPYCCFLPDLTGFESPYCAGLILHRYLSRAAPLQESLIEVVNPAVAVCRLQGTAISPFSTAMVAREFSPADFLLYRETKHLAMIETITSSL